MNLQQGKRGIPDIRHINIHPGKIEHVFTWKWRKKAIGVSIKPFWTSKKEEWRWRVMDVSQIGRAVVRKQNNEMWSKYTHVMLWCISRLPRM